MADICENMTLTTLDLTLLIDSCKPPGKSRRISAFA